jgi:glycosyltransferase involved in cell wall biosynthesis
MRVAILTQHAPAGDAIGNQTAEKLAFFLDRGAEVRVFLETSRNLHPALRGHTQVVMEPRPVGDTWEYLSSADLVIAEFGQYYPLLGLLPLLTDSGPRTLVDYHGFTPAELWDGNGREVLENAARWRGLAWCADRVIAHSDFTRRELVDATGFPAEYVAPLGHVIDCTRCAPGRPTRHLLDRPGSGPMTVLLFVGRLAPNKRVHVLVEALARLRDLIPPVHALVVGQDTDVYQNELCRCRKSAAALGVGDRLHCRGHLDDASLLDAYRSADLFVMPSRHEGFCIPVIEAMASALPVIAARAAALPQTVGDAGLTFVADDPDDLARQIRRVLGVRAHDKGERAASNGQPSPLRIAIVSFRYGTDFVGGAETSLRTIAETLHLAGQHVEVFTTCTRSVANWTNELPQGTVAVNGVTVHRFQVDPHDHARHMAAVSEIRGAGGKVREALGHEFFASSVQSAQLLLALEQRIGAFDAVIVGPYLHGLTYAVARAFPDKTLLLPCFHYEPFAQLAATCATYERVAGLLYHSPEEQELAERQLGINHPRAHCIHAMIDTNRPVSPKEAPQRLRGVGRYVVYCGRYSADKGVDRLIEHARTYHTRHPERFTFVFVGEGEVAIPREPWARDQGFVAEECKRSVLAGAAALVLLSRNESLSLAALEAWAVGTPLIADAGCHVLAGQVNRSRGGKVVHDFAGFASALDSLWNRPEHWRALGATGREYVVAHYGSRQAFADRLMSAIRDLRVPMKEQMRQRGLRRAKCFDRPAWRQQFSAVVEGLLHATPRPRRVDVEVQPRVSSRTVKCGTDAVLIPVRLINRGSQPAVPEGPGRMLLRCRLAGKSQVTTATTEAVLPGLLLPGRAVAAAVPVPVPDVAGTYEVRLTVERAGTPLNETTTLSNFRLQVVESGCAERQSYCAPLLELAEAALVEARRLERLPDNYTDVTEGWFARGKRWLKHKLLGNFKKAYVDVLSRQQSAVNAHLLTALRELTECCATLDHAVRVLQVRRGKRKNRRSKPSAGGTREEMMP